jgi:hypothetical protein
MSYVLGHVWSAIYLVLLAALTGFQLERWFFAKADLGPLRPLARCLLATVAWVVIAWVLASTGLLTLGSVSGVLVVVTVGGLITLRHSRPDDARFGEAQAAATGQWAWTVDLVCGLLAAALLVPILLLAVGPTVSWDADVYHLNLPRIYLEAGGFRDVPVLVYGHWPQATEMLYAIAMVLSDYVTAKLVHLTFGLLTLWLLATAVRRACRETTIGPMTPRTRMTSTGAAAGWLAVALVLANDVVVYELRVAYVELAQAFALLAAVLLLSAARDVKARQGDVGPLLVLAGLACGLLASIKVTGILWLPVVAAIYLPALLDRRDHHRRASATRFALAFGLPAAMLWLPWLIKAWWYTGNPVYPFAWRSLGGPWWSSAVGEQFASWQQSIGMGRGVADYLLLPIRVVLSGGAGYGQFDGRLTPLWLIALPLAVLGAWRVPLARRALGVAGGCFVLWALSSQQSRFLVPLLPLIALATAIGVARVVDRLLSARLQPLLVGSLAVASLLAAIASHATVLGAGLRRWPLYRDSTAEALYARAAPPVYAAIDALPTDARLLMIGTNHGFFCHRPYLADSFFEASQLADWLRDSADDVDALQARLAGKGITHVLLSTRPSPAPWPRSLHRLLADGRRISPLYADAQFRLLALGEI